MRIYLAGAGTDVRFLRIDGLFRDKNCFISFYDLKSKNVEKLVSHRPASIICDSGAHAFFSRSDIIRSASPVKSKEKIPDNHLKYALDYAKYCHEHKDRVDFFVELDTQEIHGKAFQLYERRMLKEAIGNDKIIGVWHGNESKQAFHKLLDEYQYIGIEGLPTKRIPFMEYMDKVKTCYQAGKRVHAFASIQNSFMRGVPFYSTDASSWANIYRFAQHFYFKDDRIKSIRKSKFTKRHISRETIRHFSAITNYESKTAYALNTGRNVLKANISAFVQFQDYLNHLWEKRGIVWEKQANLKKDSR